MDAAVGRSAPIPCGEGEGRPERPVKTAPPPSQSPPALGGINLTVIAMTVGIGDRRGAQDLGGHRTCSVEEWGRAVNAGVLLVLALCYRSQSISRQSSTSTQAVKRIKAACSRLMGFSLPLR